MVQAVAVAGVRMPTRLPMRSSSSRPRPSGGDRVGQRDAVQRVVVVDLADRRTSTAACRASPCRSPGWRPARTACPFLWRDGEGTGVLAVLHVGGDGQDGLRRDGAAVHGQALDLTHDGGRRPTWRCRRRGRRRCRRSGSRLRCGSRRSGRHRRPRRTRTRGLQRFFRVLVVDRVDLGILDGGQGVGGDGQAGHAATGVRYTSLSCSAISMDS